MEYSKQHLNPGGARLQEQFFNRGNSKKSCLHEKNKKRQCQNVENFAQHIYGIKKPPETGGNY